MIFECKTEDRRDSSKFIEANYSAKDIFDAVLDFDEEFHIGYGIPVYVRQKGESEFKEFIFKRL